MGSSLDSPRRSLPPCKMAPSVNAMLCFKFFFECGFVNCAQTLTVNYEGLPSWQLQLSYHILSVPTKPPRTLSALTHPPFVYLPPFILFAFTQLPNPAFDSYSYLSGFLFNVGLCGRFCVKDELRIFFSS